MSPDDRRVEVAAALVVAALLGGSAAAFAFTEHLKLERSPVFRTRVGKLLAPSCTCLHRRIPIQFTLRKPDRLTVVVVDSDGHVVRTLASSKPVRAGRQRFAWNGRNDRGEVVPSGTYEPRLHLANEHRTILMPNPIKVDTVAPTISLVTLVPRVFSPGTAFRKHVVLVRYRISEPARALLYVNDQRRASVVWRPYVEKGVLRWLGTGLPAGRYLLTLRAADLAGNVSAPLPIGVVRIRYLQVRPHVLQARAGTKIGFRVIADARRVVWHLANRVGGTRPGLLVLRAPKAAGRYRLLVTVGGHSAQALVIVSAGP
jgi:FlgD Ig-like domain